MRIQLFKLIEHPRSLADLLPIHVCGDSDDHRAYLLSCADGKVEGSLKCALDLVGKFLGQTIITSVPKLNESAFPCLAQ